MSPSILQIAWFGLIGVLLAGYIILDGFDLGVGFWHLCTRKEEDRRALMGSILPYWDGNEVWLLTGGGALFAAFPPVYATVFSGLYLPLMLVLFALIFRAVSLEFRNQSDSAGWKRFWDGAFAVGSIVPALLFGVAMGNVIRGLPLKEINGHVEYAGGFFNLLNPYALLIGVTGLMMFAYHGALFASMKTDGELSARAKKWAANSGIVFAMLLCASFIITMFTQNWAANIHAKPVLWTLPVAGLVIALLSVRAGMKGQSWSAFLLSSAFMLVAVVTIAVGLFPNWVPGLGEYAPSLTVTDSSSPLTLQTMLILALIGVPIVLAYTVWVHMMFKGKVGEEAGY